MKSLNSMSSELGFCLAKPRCQEEQTEILNKWNELSTLDLDLSLFRPVYAPKDFLEILSQVKFFHNIHLKSTKISLKLCQLRYKIFDHISNVMF